MPDLAPEDKEFLENLATAVVRWHMSVPIIFFLEMHKPLAYVSSQLMVVMAPLMHFLIPPNSYDRMQRLMEDRDNVEGLLCLIEKKEKERKQ